MNISLLAWFAVIVTSYLLLSPPLSQINADQLLISRTCNRTEVVTAYCEACFESNNDSAIHKDLRGLGGLAIYCAWKQLWVPHDAFSECYWTKQGDERSRCDYCAQQFGYVVHLVQEGVSMWKQSRYADCLDRLNNASDHVFDCRYNYRNIALSDNEKTLMKQAGDTSGYIDAATGVIRQLLP